MSVALAIGGFVLGVLLSGFFSGSETGMYMLNRVRLRLRRDLGDAAGVRLAKLLEEEQSTLLVALVGTTAADYLATACVAWLFVRAGNDALGAHGTASELYTTALVTPVLFVFGEAVPKNWFRRDADHLMYRGAPLLAAFSAAVRATGTIWLLRQLSHWVVRRLDPQAAARSPFDPRGQIAALLREALQERGGIGSAAAEVAEHPELIERVLSLSAKPVQAVMIPRWQVAGLRAGAAPDEVLALARRTPYTRVPVFDDRYERVIGIAHILELLDHLVPTGAATPSRRAFSVIQFVEPALMLERTETVAAAIIRMQRARQKIAIVNNRSGRPLGLLTLKDLLEEVVGDLRAW